MNGSTAGSRLKKWVFRSRLAGIILLISTVAPALHLVRSLGQPATLTHWVKWAIAAAWFAVPLFVFSPLAKRFSQSAITFSFISAGILSMLAYGLHPDRLTLIAALAFMPAIACVAPNRVWLGMYSCLTFATYCLVDYAGGGQFADRVFVTEAWGGVTLAALAILHIISLWVTKDSGRESRSQLQELRPDDLHDILFVFRLLPRKEFQFISGAVTNILGYSREDFSRDAELGTKILHPADQNVTSVNPFAAQKSQPHMVRLRHQKGHYVWVEFLTAALRNAANETVAVQGVAREVRGRVSEAQTAELKKDRFRRGITASGMAVWQWSLSTNKVTWQGSTQWLLGGDPDALESTFTDLLRMVHNNDKEAFRGSLTKAIATQNTFEMEFRLARSDGGICWVSSRGDVFSDASGNPELVMGNVVDITEKKSALLAQQQAMAMLSLTLDSTGNGVVVLDTQGNILVENNKVKGLVSIQGGDWVAGFANQIVTPLAFQETLRQNFGSATLQMVVQLASGKMLDVYSQEVELSEGSRGRMWSLHDITGITEVREALRESVERYELALRGANDGLWDWNRLNNNLYLSARWKSQLGLPENAPLALNDWWSLIHTDDIASLLAAWNDFIASDRTHIEREARILHADGKLIWVLIRGAAVRDEQGEVTRIAGSMTDISHHKNAERRLLHEAYHDFLTGLGNRSLFLKKLKRFVSRKVKGEPSFAVLFLDLNRFKLVNDSMGHAAGDELLVSVARRLQACLRPGDLLARLGGDEFAVLLVDVRSLLDVTHVANRIKAQFHKPFVVENTEIYTSTSIGIALSDNRYATAEEMIRDADTAMYRAKTAGDENFVIFNAEMHTMAMETLELENDLRRAIERDELCLFYQPIVKVDTMAIVGFEALLRWKHGRRGLLEPGEFIKTAEETRLILPIGAWALRQACMQLAAWQAAYPLPLPLSMNVNLSPLQFTQHNLVEGIAEIIAETHIAPDTLRLEITETVMMDTGDELMAKLNGLTALGAQVQIDDFGTGFSSLSYLHQYPIRALKIDRSFVSQLHTGGIHVEIVKTIAALAKHMKLGIIAEGVETESQLRQLRLLDCGYMQGFLFSKPIPAAEAEILLQERIMNSMKLAHS